MTLFSKDPINTGRQNYIDTAKTFSIIFMVLVHVALYCCDLQSMPIQAYIIEIILGGIYAAPVFMFCMGIGISYSRSGSDPSLLAKRGCKLYLQGILLNIVRSLVIGFLAALIYKRRDLITASISNALLLDILFFAGISFLLIALLKKLKLSEMMIFVIAIAMSVIGSFLNGATIQNPILEFVVSHFIHTNYQWVLGCNPLFTWFIFPAGGMLFGKLLKNCTDIKKLFRILTPVSTALTVIYLGYSIGSHRSFYAGLTEEAQFIFKSMPTIDGIGILFVIISFIGICWFITGLLAQNTVNRFINTSNNITGIYVIHWLILNTFIYFIIMPLGLLPGITVYPIGFALFIVSNLLANKIKKQGLLL